MFFKVFSDTDRTDWTDNTDFFNIECSKGTHVIRVIREIRCSNNSCLRHYANSHEWHVNDSLIFMRHLRSICAYSCNAVGRSYIDTNCNNENN